jgi:hypothetical protein
MRWARAAVLFAPSVHFTVDSSTASESLGMSKGKTQSFRAVFSSHVGCGRGTARRVIIVQCRLPVLALTARLLFRSLLGFRVCFACGCLGSVARSAHSPPAL